ncbi:MAG: prefoldin subunit alpha [Candidatus Thalassarchaeaceae archaeon]|nr:prefoldin subunit alpha [Candidatus Thalassarchaeaceae archaeon]
MEAAELQRIAQLVELNRQKMARLEEQISKLREIHVEQTGVLSALQAMDNSKQTMIPLGAGVQLPTTSTNDAVVIDIGSGIQAERPREEAIIILQTRMTDVMEVLTALESEFNSTEKMVIELATTFNEAANALKASEEETTSEPEPTQKSRRRRRGTELTLDD